MGPIKHLAFNVVPLNDFSSFQVPFRIVCYSPDCGFDFVMFHAFSQSNCSSLPSSGEQLGSVEACVLVHFVVIHTNLYVHILNKEIGENSSSWLVNTMW